MARSFLSATRPERFITGEHAAQSTASAPAPSRSRLEIAEKRRESDMKELDKQYWAAMAKKKEEYRAFLKETKPNMADHEGPGCGCA